MRQTLAILVDSYRELNARKMFWITMILSALVVCVLFLIGITDDEKLRLAFWTMPFPLPPSLTLDTLLKATFVSLGIGFWLTWAAAILALISTASIFPDFISSGSIDLVLSKPIGRLRLFLTKYLGGLLFVALQVAAFSGAAFLIIGARTGSWEPGLFISVPLVVVFFSYLFCICTLVGLLTRSTIASLLLTLLFWLALFGLNFADQMLAIPHMANEEYVAKVREQVDELSDAESDAAQARLDRKQVELEEAIESRDTWRRWHHLVVGIKTFLPKTGETIGLLERWLIETAELPEGAEDDQQQQNPFITPKMYAAGVRMDDVAVRVQEMYRERSVLWVLGTSLLFEAFILAICGWVFTRRDF